MASAISQNNKPIAFFSQIISKAQLNQTTTEKEILFIVKFLKQFQGILFEYKIDVFSDHKNLVYEATIRASHRFMRWGLVLEEFGPNIQHKAGIYNKVVDTLSRLPSANIYQYKSSIVNDSRQANELFQFNNDEDDKFNFH